MQQSAGARAEWKAAWPLPVVSALGYGTAISYIYSLGIFIEPLESQFRWSRAEVISGLTIVSIVFVIVAPFTGAFIDRFGSRRLALPGMLAYCAALAALSLATASIWSWWLLWVLLALGAVCVQAAVWTTAVASRFERSRGLAIAVTLCGAGVGSAVAPLLAEFYLTRLGWRGAYVGLAATFSLLTLPLIFLFFYDAADRPIADEPVSRDRSRIPGLGVKEALKSSRFLRMALLSLAVVTAMTALLVHFVPILVGKGLAKPTAAVAASVIGIGSIAGRLGGGVLLDRVRGTILGAIAFSLPILATMALFFYHGGAMGAFFLAALLGVSLGGEVDVLAYLTTRYFGLRNFGTLFAVIIALQTVALGMGPLIAAAVYDRFGSYDPLLIGLVPVFLISAVIVGTLGPYPTEFDAESGGNLR